MRSASSSRAWDPGGARHAGPIDAATRDRLIASPRAVFGELARSASA
jgi:hypothetical protein